MLKVDEEVKAARAALALPGASKLPKPTDKGMGLFLATEGLPSPMMANKHVAESTTASLADIELADAASTSLPQSPERTPGRTSERSACSSARSTGRKLPEEPLVTTPAPVGRETRPVPPWSV